MSTKSSESKQFWFPAKRYGWGWGLPSVWQGWAVLVVFAVLLGVGALVFPPSHRHTAFIVYSTLLALLLVAVCWAKGEPPKWRWGED
jgi:hypothetical protein